MRPISVSAEVRVEDNQIVMEISDFRSLMSDLAEAESERDALRDILKTERASQDYYISQVNDLRETFEIERDVWARKVNEGNIRSIWIGLVGIGIGAAIN